MKVRELIALLQKANPESEVTYFASTWSEYGEHISNEGVLRADQVEIYSDSEPEPVCFVVSD